MTPAERSNSPPIMSSATGTAMIPYWAAWSVQPAAIPGSPIQFTPRAKYANVKKTATAPSSAPMSGRARSRASGPTRTRRSSGRMSGAAVSAMAVPPLRRVGDRAAAHPDRFLAGSLRSEGGYFGRVRLVDDAGAGQHRLAVADRVQVGHE